jgi:peptidyl-prolyl cis-trans isomerase C
VISREEMEAAERQMLADYQGSEQELRKVKQKSPRGREVVRDRLMIRRFMELLLQGVEVEEQEVVARFKERRELFVRPREVRVRQILVGTLEEATDLQRRIKKGEEFSRLARVHSMGPEASSGGDLGYVRPGQVPPEIEEVVFGLDQGEASEIVPSVYGFHILKVEDRKGPEEVTFSEVRWEIHERLLAEKATNAFQAWMKDEWRGAQIEVLDPSLASVVERRGVGS